MKYKLEIVIDRSREEVLKLMENLENLKHWQEGLKSYQVLTGKPGEEGTRTKLDYDLGKRKMTLTETILKNKMPAEMHAAYETKGVHNVQENYFKSLADNQTLWVSRSEFRFTSFGMKVVGLLFAKSFKKQSLKYMQDFKAFAERGKSVSNK